jgi:hypothetical protein
MKTATVIRRFSKAALALLAIALLLSASTALGGMPIPIPDSGEQAPPTAASEKKGIILQREVEQKGIILQHNAAEEKGIILQRDASGARPDLQQKATGGDNGVGEQPAVK